jgi:hypothetical protein
MRSNGSCSSQLFDEFGQLRAEGAYVFDSVPIRNANGAACKSRVVVEVEGMELAAASVVS